MNVDEIINDGCLEMEFKARTETDSLPLEFCVKLLDYALALVYEKSASFRMAEEVIAGAVCESRVVHLTEGNR